jgi:hypothetical protein
MKTWYLDGELLKSLAAFRQRLTKPAEVQVMANGPFWRGLNKRAQTAEQFPNEFPALSLGTVSSFLSSFNKLIFSQSHNLNFEVLFTTGIFN